MGWDGFRSAGFFFWFLFGITVQTPHLRVFVRLHHLIEWLGERGSTVDRFQGSAHPVCDYSGGEVDNHGTEKSHPDIGVERGGRERNGRRKTCSSGMLHG